MNIKNKFWGSVNIGNNLIFQVYQICLLQYITVNLLLGVQEPHVVIMIFKQREIT